MGSESKRVGKELKIHVGKNVREVQLRVWQAITYPTPVNLGTARAGWVPSTGSPVLDPVQTPKDDNAAKIAAAARLARNVARVERIAATYDVDQGPIYFTNTVPWIVFLNEGSSSQAPSNFVERGIRTALGASGS